MATRLVVQEVDGAVSIVVLQNEQTSDSASLRFSHSLGPSLTDAEMEELRWYLEDYLDAPYGVYSDRAERVSNKLPAWGARLFRALFPPNSEAYTAYKQASANTAWELWLASDSVSFLSLPWELLREQEDTTAKAVEIAIVRRVSGTPRSDSTQASGTLRVLMVIARPANLDGVPYGVVGRGVLNRLLAAQRPVAIKVLRPPTFGALRSELATAASSEPYDVLHFDGHGAVGDATPYSHGLSEGFLAFESGTTEADLVSATDLVGVLRRYRVPLIVLNSCRGGKIGSGVAIETSIATALLRAGATAVVGMSYVVYADSAAQFAEAFYQHISAGGTVADGVLAGRKRLYARASQGSRANNQLQDWTVPVLYANAPLAFRLTSRPPVESTKLTSSSSRDLPATGITSNRFFGRDAEILQLERELRSNQVVLVHGLAGVGKSELVNRFLMWLSDTGGLEGPVYRFAFEASSTGSALESFLASLGETLLDLSFAQKRLSTDERRRVVLNALSAPGAMLIVDPLEIYLPLVGSRADTKTPIIPLPAELQEFLLEVVGTGTKVVLVTRNPYLWFDKASAVAINVLPPSDAIPLANHIVAGSSAQGNDPDATDLLYALTGHPLSMKLVLPLLKERKAGDLLHSLRPRTPAEGGGAAEEGSLPELLASVEKCFQRITPQERLRLAVLVFYEGPIDAMVVTALRDMPDLPEPFRVEGYDAWSDALLQCITAGLLTPVRDVVGFIPHPALRAWLYAYWRRTSGPRFLKEFKQLHLAHIRVVASIAMWLLQKFRLEDAPGAIAQMTLNEGTITRAATDAIAIGAYEEASHILRTSYGMMLGQTHLNKVRKWADLARRATEKNGELPDPNSPAGGLWLLTISQLGYAELRAGHPDAAEALLQSVVSSLSKAQSDAQEPSGQRRHLHRLAVANYDLSQIALERKQLDVAEALCKEALVICESIGHKLHSANCYDQLGNIADARGDPQLAETHYSRALEICEEIGNTPGVAVAGAQLATLVGWGGKPEGAIGGLDEALESAITLDDKHQQELLHSRLGNFALARREFSTAERHYQNALKIAHALRDPAGVVRGYHNLGTLAFNRKDFDGAKEWTKKSVEVAQAAGLMDDVLRGMSRLSLLLCVAHEWRKGLEYTIQCIVVAGAIGQQVDPTVTDNLLGTTHELGLPVLEEVWLECTGMGLPTEIRDFVRQQLGL